MKDIYKILEENNITLPTPPAKGGIYSPVIEFGNEGKLLYCSGCGPAINGEKCYIGKLGKDFTVEDGQKAAYNCVLNLLANLQYHIGDLNKIKKFVKVLAFVNSADDFEMQPQVINGGSKLLFDIFGDNGLPARSAIGTNSLPGGIAVEIEVLVELK